MTSVLPVPPAGLRWSVCAGVLRDLPGERQNQPLPQARAGDLLQPSAAQPNGPAQAGPGELCHSQDHSLQPQKEERRDGKGRKQGNRSR